METKRCSKCGEVKGRDKFSKASKYKDGLSCWCKDCFRALRESQKDAIRIKKQAYYKANKEEICKRNKEIRERKRDEYLERQKAYREKNKELIRERARISYSINKEAFRERAKKWRDANAEKHRTRARNYRIRNKAKVNAYLRQRYRDSPIHAMRVSVRNRLARLFSSTRKIGTTLDVLGCDWPTFTQHIERQFLKGMSWDNRSEWHIDHIVPLATAKTEEDVIQLNHYTNLRPLWAKDNLSKGAKIEHLI